MNKSCTGSFGEEIIGHCEEIIDHCGQGLINKPYIQ
jgi:hypothetical protein